MDKRPDGQKASVKAETTKKRSLPADHPADEELDNMIGLVDLPEAVSDTESAEEEASRDVPDDFFVGHGAGSRPGRAARVGRALSRSAGRAGRAMGSAFYEVGYYAEYVLVRLGRAIARGSRAAGHYLLKGLLWFGRMLVFLPRAVLLLVARPVWHLINACRNVREIWYTRDPDKPGQTWKNTFSYLRGGIRRHTHLLLELLGWALPVAAGALFVFTVRTVMDNRYVLQLSYNNNVLGYVASEEVFETAQQDVQSRIVYTDEDTSGRWGLQPTYTLAVDDNLQLMNSDQVADAILATSGEEITEATGFYLNGVFYGAVTDGARLKADLESIKDPYCTGEEGETVSFVNEPQLVDGVYLRSSVVDYDTIGNLIHGQVAGEVQYTVQNGDTPSEIANDHGLTTAELYSMNPGLEGGGMYPGDTLIISQAVSFLQVQVTYRRVEQETVPYQTVRTNTADLSFGYTKVQTEGVDGVNNCTYDYVYIDGVLISKTLVETTVVSDPVNEEILVGTAVRSGVTMVPSSGAFMWPIPGYTYVSRGFTGLYAHNGMDICAAYGTPIYASQSGVVTTAKYTGVGYGVYVVIDHGNGYSTRYGHCSSLVVSAGQIVNQGDLIAYVGSTGNSTGNHCHFEIMINGTQVNPAPYVGNG